MPIIAWDESLSIGYELIDDQHKQLIALASKLRAAMSGDRDRQVSSLIIIAEIIDCARVHFATEERLMEERHYPLMASHASLHVDAMRKAVDLRCQYVAGQSDLTIPHLQFIEAWQVNHIQRSDRALGLFLAATASVGKTAVVA